MTKLGFGMMLVALVAMPQTIRPGEMTQAKVWVQDTPLPVRLVNGVGDQGTPIAVRSARQPWEYETVRIAASQDVASVLNPRGAAGWEVAGVISTPDAGTTLILKRPN